MANTNSRSDLNATNASIVPQTENDFIEVSGLMDGFSNIEEFAPGSNWEEVLAAGWGVPCAVEPEKSYVLAGITASAIRSLRSILHGVRSKKFEIA